VQPRAFSILQERSPVFAFFEKALSRLRKNQARFSGTIAELKEERPVAPAPEREGDFGLTVQNVTAEIAQRRGLKQAQGVVITAVERRSPADDAGLRRGDVILDIDRKTVRNLLSTARDHRFKERRVLPFPSATRSEEIVCLGKNSETEGGILTGQGFIRDG
jgi:predicted metalloprotease with PDZ domain